MKTAIITGATGFIGKQLSLSLLAEGIEVYGVGRSDAKFKELEEHPKFHKINLDFEQYEKISEVLANVEIDVFFHAAYRGVNGPRKSDYLVQLQNLNTACTTVMQAIKLHCKRYVYIGSVDEFEVTKSPDMPFVEPTHSRVYAAIKYSSEVIGKVLAFEHNLEYVSALLALTYGQGNGNNVLPNMIIRNSVNDQPINLISGENYFDMIHISEAIEGIEAVANYGRPYESYFIGHEKLRTFREIVEDISAIIGNKKPLNFGTYPDPSFSLDYEKIDRSKLFRDTGYTANKDFEKAIIETKRWLERS